MSVCKTAGRNTIAPPPGGGRDHLSSSGEMVEAIIRQNLAQFRGDICDGPGSLDSFRGGIS